MIDYRSYQLFSTLQTEDVIVRKNLLEELEKEFEFDELELFPTENNNDCNGYKFDKISCYPIILRLAHECPFEDIRHSCYQILEKLEVAILAT